MKPQSRVIVNKQMECVSDSFMKTSTEQSFKKPPPFTPQVVYLKAGTS